MSSAKQTALYTSILTASNSRLLVPFFQYGFDKLVDRRGFCASSCCSSSALLPLILVIKSRGILPGKKMQSINVVVDGLLPNASLTISAGKYPSKLSVLLLIF
uniref:Uncharacterized protein n=1 Tax=Vibrio parahaemolyticus TaxID=670 RepID=A0A0C5GSS2_VIBPH|nr:hypothetical protein pVPH1_0239 [Vibrio parahaemolyticus]